MKAILLAAGYGTRLRPLTDFLPKCILPINGIPLLDYWFRLLIKAGVFPLLVNLHYKAEIVREWVEKTVHRNRIRMVYEEVLFGTGGTLLKNRDFVGNEPVMLIHADNLSLFDIEGFIKAHMERPKGTLITMMTFKTPTPETCGIVKVDSKGIVRGFYEKVKDPPGNLANAAVYIVEPDIIDFLLALSKNVIDFSTEVLPHFIEDQKVYTFFNGIYHRDIGTIDSYIDAQKEYPYQNGEEDKEPWSGICKKDDGLQKGFLEALSRAIDARLIDIKEVKGRGLKSKEEERYIVFSPDTDRYMDVLIDLSDDKEIKSSIALIYFKKAGHGFSSKGFFDRTGLRSMVLYRD